MTRARSTLVGLVAVTTLAVSGCGSTADLVPPKTEAEIRDDDTDASAIEPKPLDLPTQLATTGSTRLRDVARQRLRAAKRSFVRDSTGRFVRATAVGDAVRREWNDLVRMRSAFDLGRLRSRSTMRLYDGSGESLRIRVRTRGRRTFYRLGPWPCWVTMTPQGYERISGTPVPAGAMYFPPEVQGLLAARPATMHLETDKVVATVPLAVAATLAGPTIDRKLPNRARGVRVPALIQVRSKRFVGWSLHGVDLLAALEDSSIRIGRRLQTALPYVKVDVTLARPGAPVRVPVPPRSERTKPDEFDPTACGGVEST